MIKYVAMVLVLFGITEFTFARPILVPRPNPIPVPVPAPKPKEVYFPSSQYPNLQSAVDEVANKGIVHINPGAYDGSFELISKDVTIRGEGQNRNQTEIRFFAGTLAKLKGKANLTLENITLTSQSASPLISSEMAGPGVEKAALSLTKVRLNGGGIAGSYKSVLLDTVQIQTSAKVGLSLQEVTGVVLKTVDVNAGIEIKSKEKCSLNLNLVGVTNPVVPGIYLHGPLCEGQLNMVRVVGARKAGVEVDEVRNLKIQNSSILKTQPSAEGADLGKFGDGLLIRFSDVYLENNVIDESRRAGVSVFGCSDFAPAIARLKNNRIFRSAFDMDIETQEHPFMIFLRAQGKTVRCNGGGQLQDLSGNVCGAPSAEKDCKAASSSMDPLPPPTRP